MSTPWIAILRQKDAVPNINTKSMIPGLGLCDSVLGSSSELSTPLKVPVNPIILVTNPAGVSIDVKYAPGWRRIKATTEKHDLRVQWFKSEALNPLWQSRSALYSLVVDTKERAQKQLHVVNVLGQHLAENRQDLDKIAKPGEPGGYFHNPKRDYLTDERRRLRERQLDAENRLAQRQIEAMKARSWHRAREVGYSHKPTPPPNSRYGDVLAFESSPLQEKNMLFINQHRARLAKRAQKESGQQRTPLPDRPMRAGIQV